MDSPSYEDANTDCYISMQINQPLFEPEIEMLLQLWEEDNAILKPIPTVVY